MLRKVFLASAFMALSSVAVAGNYNVGTYSKNSVSATQSVIINGIHHEGYRRSFSKQGANYTFTFNILKVRVDLDRVVRLPAVWEKSDIYIPVSVPCVIKYGTHCIVEIDLPPPPAPPPPKAEPISVPPITFESG
jgi:hypothetical protein